MNDRERQRLDIFGISRHAQTLLAQSNGVLARRDAVVGFEVGLGDVGARCVDLEAQDAHILVAAATSRESASDRRREGADGGSDGQRSRHGSCCCGWKQQRGHW